LNYLPLTAIFSFPLNIQAIYFFLSLLVAVIGKNRAMGFWGNLFFSAIFSPLLGIIVVSVSGKKQDKK